MPYKPAVTDPNIDVDTDALVVRVATFCKNQGITNQAGWETRVGQAFNATNASGLNAATRTFLIEFFTKMIKVG
jgi:hypothetical protein